LLDCDSSMHQNMRIMFCCRCGVFRFVKNAAYK
jgi:hypothetical protein